MIVIERVSNSTYYFGNSDKSGIKKVCRCLTFTNPDPWAYTEKIKKFNERNLTFKIGMLQNVIDYAEVLEEKCVVNDFKFEVPDVEIDERMSGKYAYQAEAVKAFYKRRFGIIQVPTRGGKTFIAAEIIRLFLETNKTGKFCFIVDNTTLFSQAIDDFKRYFEKYGGIEIGKIKGSEVDFGKRVTVAMIQSLQSQLNSKVRRKGTLKFLKELRFLAIDEIHDNASDARLSIYKKCKQLDYLLGLSATPYRKNKIVQNLKLQEWSGGVVYQITEEMLREIDVLSDYKVFMLLIDHNVIDYDTDEDYASLRENLIFRSKVRNDILRQIVAVLKEAGLKTLLLFQSIEHGELMAEALGETFISGKNDSRVREKVKQHFLACENGGVLLASNIYKKGVTLPQVEVLINCDEGLEESNVIQRKGRVLGRTEYKTRSLIIDFFDLYDLYFNAHSEQRLDTYVASIGEDKVGILDTSIDEWIVTFKRWVYKWFMKDVK